MDGADGPENSLKIDLSDWLKHTLNQVHKEVKCKEIQELFFESLLAYQNIKLFVMVDGFIDKSFNIAFLGKISFDCKWLKKKTKNLQLVTSLFTILYVPANYWVFTVRTAPPNFHLNLLFKKHIKTAIIKILFLLVLYPTTVSLLEQRFIIIIHYTPLLGHSIGIIKTKVNLGKGLWPFILSVCYFEFIFLLCIYHIIVMIS